MARLREQSVKLPQLQRGFHLAGYSQGGLIARLYAQLHNPLPPLQRGCESGSCHAARPFRVVSLLSLHAPQAGISQVPPTPSRAAGPPLLL